MREKGDESQECRLKTKFLAKPMRD